MKKIKGDTNKWKDIPWSWIGRLNFIKISVLPKAVLGFSAIPIELPKEIFADLVEKNLMETQRPQMAKAILTKKNGHGGIRLLDFRLYYKTTVIKTV